MTMVGYDHGGLWPWWVMTMVGYDHGGLWPWWVMTMIKQMRQLFKLEGARLKQIEAYSKAIAKSVSVYI